MASKKASKRTRKASKPKRNAYEVVTDRILELLDEGTVPWRKPWSARLGGNGMPRNIDSDREYRGVNVWMLHASCYGSPYWTTYKQAQKYGGNVRKGESGTPVVFWKMLTRRHPEDPELVKMVPMLRLYWAWNVEQCDGLDDRLTALGAIEEPTEEPEPFEPIEAAQRIADGYPKPPRIDHGGGVACYMPGVDVVRMPKPETFHSREEYYSTLFHELGHSTGHGDRLDRKFGKTFGDHAYSREELVAEMTAAYLQNEAGILPSTEENSAAYLASWSKKLKADPKCVVVAAQAAQKAADWILDRQPAAMGVDS